MSAMTIAISLVASDMTGGAFGSLISNANNIQTTINRMTGNVRGLTGQMAPLAAGTTAAALAFEAFKGATEYGIGAAAELESKLVGLLNATQDEASMMPVLTSAVNDLAIRTVFGTDDATAAFERMIEMGFNTQQVLYGMDKAASQYMDGAYHAGAATKGLGNEALIMAQAMRTDAVTGAALLGAAVHIFANEGLSAETIANNLAGAFLNGVPSAEALNQALAMSGASAATAGIKMQDFLVTLDLLTQNGMSASSAGASLNYMITSLIAPTDKQAKMMAYLGITTAGVGQQFQDFLGKLAASGAAGKKAADQFDGTVASLKDVYKAGQDAGLINLDETFNQWALKAGALSSKLFDAKGNFVGMKRAIEILNDAMVGKSMQEKMDILANLFNVRSGRAAKVLLNVQDFSDQYDAILGRFGKVQLDKMADRQLHTLLGALDAFKDSFKSAMANMFMPILPYISDFLLHLNDILGWFNGLDPKIKTAVAVFLILGTVFSGLVAVAGAVALAIAGLAALGVGLGAIFAGAGIALAAILVYIGYGIGAFFAIRAAIAAVNDPTSQFGGFLRGIGAAALVVWGWLQQFGSFLATTFGPTFRDIGDFLQNVIGKNFDAVGKTMQGVFLPAWQNLQDSLKQMEPLWQVLLPVLQSLGIGLGALAAIIVGVLIGAITGLLGAIVSVIAGIIQIFAGLVSIISGVLQVIMGIVQLVVGVIVAVFTGQWGKIPGIVMGALTMIWNGVKSILGGLLQVVIGIFQALIGGVIALVAGFITGIISWFTHLYETLVGHSIIPDLARAVIMWIARMAAQTLAHIIVWVNDAKAHAAQFVAGILSAILSLPGRVGGVIQNVLSTARNLLGTLASIGANAGRGLIDNIVGAIRAGIGAVGSAVGAIANTIAGFLHHSVPDEGPLANDDVWMVDFVNNLASGMTSRLHVLKDAAMQVASTISTGINTPNTTAVAVRSAGPVAGASGQVNIPINLDGKQIAQYTVDLATGQLKQAGMSRFAR
jgi:TP901 family phage tail tape measure protein